MPKRRFASGKLQYILSGNLQQCLIKTFSVQRYNIGFLKALLQHLLIVLRRNWLVVKKIKHF